MSFPGFPAIKMTGSAVKIVLLSANAVFPGLCRSLWYEMENFTAAFIVWEKDCLRRWYLITFSCLVNNQKKLASNDWYVFKAEPRADGDISSWLALQHILINCLVIIDEGLSVSLLSLRENEVIILKYVLHQLWVYLPPLGSEPFSK